MLFYGEPYREVVFNESAMKQVYRSISKTDLKWQDAQLNNSDNPIRKSEIAWLNDRSLLTMLFSMCQQVNKDAGWNLAINHVEPVQFGIYPEGGHYSWHADQHDNKRDMVRKISMSLFLNEDYEGGEFDLDLYKPEYNNRSKAFKLKEGTALFFLSDTWHRVRPVRSGVRKSLVAWFSGPPYV